MKKYILAIGLFLIGSHISAQDISSEIGSETEFVTEVSSSKNSLFLNAQTWASGNSTERGVEIETVDKETGTVILKVSTKLPRKEGINSYSIIYVQMNVKIDCRDNKYRVTFSNFTSSVSADRSIEQNYLSTSSLQEMIKELKLVTRLAETRFDKEVFWGLEKILEAKEYYQKQNVDYREAIASFDATSKKGKKEIKWRESWIEENDGYINYLSYILHGFGNTVREIHQSLSKSMNVSDDF